MSRARNRRRSARGSATSSRSLKAPRRRRPSPRRLKNPPRSRRPAAEAYEPPPVDELPEGEPGIAEEPPAAQAPGYDEDPWLDEEPDEVPAEEALQERPRRPAAETVAEDDVLEETPDFLQETPEHDRLWFEQKPPREFDWDK